MADVDSLIEGPVLTLVINRPDKKNSLTSAMYQTLFDGLQALQERDDLRVGVLRGSGPDFCAGNDLFDFAAPGDPDAPVTSFLRGLAEAPKPLVAAVNGKAIGVGATMLLHCDVVHLSTDAELRFPFVDLGLVPEAGSTLLLPQLAGRRRAASALLLGRPVPAADALSWGIATEVNDDPDAAASASAAALAAKPPQALAATKRLLWGDRTSLLQQMSVEGSVFAKLLAGGEFAAAAERFRSQRS